MTWTAPFTAVSGAIITAAGWNTSGRDNLLHLRNLLPDASGASLPLVSSGTTSAAFGQLPTAGLADAAVTTAKIADVNVTTGKLADLAVTSPKIASDAVNTGNIVDGAVTTAKILDGTIATGDIADLAVTDAKIANTTISNGKLATGFKQGNTGEFSGSQSLTTSYADLASCSFSADRDGQWFVILNCEMTFAIGDGQPSCQIVADGVAQEEGLGTQVAGSTTLGPCIAVALVTVSGTDTIKAQVKKASGSASSLCSYGKITGFWLAP